jgi:TRAP-type mannitol/chloroaromatic compound transport system permease large subunit
MIFASQIGVITPPFGLAVFTVKGVAEADVKLEDVFAGSLTYFAVMVVGIVVLMAFPQIVTFLL